MEEFSKQETKAKIRIVRRFWHRPWVITGLVFIFGMMAGMLTFSILRSGESDGPDPLTEMKGTLYDSRSYDQMKTADNLQFENSLVKTIFAVRYSAKIVEIRVDLSSLYSVKATVEFDFNNFEVLNVRNVSVNDQSSAVSAANYIQMINTGDNKFIIQLYNKNSLSHNIRFAIFQNDIPVYQNSVTVNKE
jgi:hypothetical protein